MQSMMCHGPKNKAVNKATGTYFVSLVDSLGSVKAGKLRRLGILGLVSLQSRQAGKASRIQLLNRSNCWTWKGQPHLRTSMARLWSTMSKVVAWSGWPWIETRWRPRGLQVRGIDRGLWAAIEWTHMDWRWISMAFEASRKEDFSCESRLLSFHFLRKVLHAWCSWQVLLMLWYELYSIETWDPGASFGAEHSGLVGSVQLFNVQGCLKIGTPPKDRKLLIDD